MVSVGSGHARRCRRKSDREHRGRSQVVSNSAPSTSFEGRSVIVTGAAKGIGRATAEQFALAGATVTLVDRDREAADAVAAAIGNRALAIAADVADERAVDSAVA